MVTYQYSITAEQWQRGVWGRHRLRTLESPRIAMYYMSYGNKWSACLLEPDHETTSPTQQCLVDEVHGPFTAWSISASVGRPSSPIRPVSVSRSRRGLSYWVFPFQVSQYAA